MNIETKYNIEDAVWIMRANKPEGRVVNYVYCKSEKPVQHQPVYTAISYSMAGLVEIYPEELVFSSKEELLKSLL